MYIHSISCNKDNQDIVSMGTNAALLARKVIDNSFEVITIHLMAIITAIHYLKIEDKLAPATKHYYDDLSKIIPPVIVDSELSDTINKGVEFLKKYEL